MKFKPRHKLKFGKVLFSWMTITMAFATTLKTELARGVVRGEMPEGGTLWMKTTTAFATTSKAEIVLEEVEARDMAGDQDTVEGQDTVGGQAYSATSWTTTMTGYATIIKAEIVLEEVEAQDMAGNQDTAEIPDFWT